MRLKIGLTWYALSSSLLVQSALVRIENQSDHAIWARINQSAPISSLDNFMRMQTSPGPNIPIVLREQAFKLIYPGKSALFKSGINKVSTVTFTRETPKSRIKEAFTITTNISALNLGAKVIYKGWGKAYRK